MELMVLCEWVTIGVMKDTIVFIVQQDNGNAEMVKVFF